MMLQEVTPRLQAWVGDHRSHRPTPILRQLFHTFGLSESDVDARLKGLVGKKAGVDLGLLASPLGVLISLTTKGAGLHTRRGRAPVISDDVLQPFAQEVRMRVGDSSLPRALTRWKRWWDEYSLREVLRWLLQNLAPVASSVTV